MSWRVDWYFSCKNSTRDFPNQWWQSCKASREHPHQLLLGACCRTDWSDTSEAWEIAKILQSLSFAHRIFILCLWFWDPFFYWSWLRPQKSYCTGANIGYSLYIWMVTGARPVVTNNYQFFKEMVTNGEAVFFRKEARAIGYLYAKCPVSLKRTPESFPWGPKFCRQIHNILNLLSMIALLYHCMLVCEAGEVKQKWIMVNLRTLRQNSWQLRLMLLFILLCLMVT